MAVLDPPQSGNGGSAPVPGPGNGSESRLDKALRGALPCIGCGYELRGLSVRNQCPECGLAVRATILYAVDPHADAFKPLRRPWLTANAIVLWTGAALAAALVCWIPRISDLSERVFGVSLAVRSVGWIPAALALLSGLGALAMACPIAGSARKDTIRARLSLLAYIPLIAALGWLHVAFDPAHPAPYLAAGPQTDRIALRMIIAASAIAAMIGLRPCARSLVARSLVLRTGRVDRQTIAATVAAVLVAAIGDVVRLVSLALPASGGASRLVDQAGSTIILVGSLLITLAIYSALVDSLRIRRAILLPSPSLRALLDGH